MEIFRRFSRWVYSLAFDPEIDVDAGELEKLRELGRRAPLVFIPSHKSNCDHMALYSLLFSSGFPPPHTAAGINMSFFPMSRILPGTGAYFLRRSFQDDPIYKESLRGFINTLVQRRFHQEFFIEGGRSRSGKLLPPRYGILQQHRRRRAARHDIGEVLFVPTSIAYDQILELSEYVRQNLGDEKEAESFVFLRAPDPRGARAQARADPHPLRRADLAARVSRSQRRRPAAGREAGVPDLEPDQRGHSDHAGRAGLLGPARRGQAGARRGRVRRAGRRAWSTTRASAASDSPPRSRPAQSRPCAAPPRRSPARA